MCHDFIQVWASLRVSRKDSCNKVSGCVRNVDVIRERVAVLADASVRGFHISRLEGRLSYDERVDDDAEGPDVDLVRVSAFAFKDLRSDVVRGAANGTLFLAVEV